MKPIFKITAILMLCVACSSDDETTAPPDPRKAFVGEYEISAYQFQYSFLQQSGIVEMGGGEDIEIELVEESPDEVKVEGLVPLIQNAINAFVIQINGVSGTISSNQEVLGQIQNNELTIPETDFILTSGNQYGILVFSGSGELKEGTILFEFEYEITDSGLGAYFNGEAEMEKQ